MELFESPLEAAEAADEALRRRLGGRVVGTYLHGSAVLGGFVPGRSDTDVLVVVADDVGRTALTPAVDELSVNGGCRGTGIELSIVTAEAARTSAEPWPFLVHVVTGATATRVVWGSELPGDRDLLMHTAVVRAAGVAIGGPSPDQTFGPVDRPAVLGYLVDEMYEAVECATPTYTVLNACRAYRFLVTGDLVSKLDGAAWARCQPSAAPFVPAIDAAVAHQRTGSSVTPDGDEARRLALMVAALISGGTDAAPPHAP